MKTAAAEAPKSTVDAEAFAFVQALASELSRGKVDLPSFPDIALRVRQVLSDENVTQEQVVRVVSSEPALLRRGKAAAEWRRSCTEKRKAGDGRSHKGRYVTLKCGPGGGSYAGIQIAYRVRA